MPFAGLFWTVRLVYQRSFQNSAPKPLRLRFGFFEETDPASGDVDLPHRALAILQTPAFFGGLNRRDANLGFRVAGHPFWRAL